MIQTATKTKFRFLLFLTILFLNLNGIGQSIDSRLWTGLSLEKKLNNRLEASIGVEYRLENNLAYFDKFLLEPALNFKFNKAFSIQLTYRYWFQQNDENNLINRSRTSFELNYSKKIKDLNIKLESKLQYGFADRLENASFYSKNLVSRNSLKLSYSIFGTRFTPFAKFELFTSLEEFNPLNYQSRAQVGSDIYLTSKTDLRLFYLFENEFNVLDAIDSNVFGISLKYAL
ncbi:MAG: DUF2490 domain-containing protein [Bacteroidales bacterium]|nr:DUF2490 domain-containing protein [Bacteroidales bacterium]